MTELSSPRSPARPQRVIPIAVAGSAAPRSRQGKRLAFQVGFFILFVLAPVFDLFRYDLNADHAWLLGMEWRLGLDDFLAGKATALEAAGNIMLRLFVPLMAGAGLFIWAAWKWGRLYCGWLCPHFSVVETINKLMARASGKPSVWEKFALPRWNTDGSPRRVDVRWWAVVVPAAVAFAFLWAVVLLTYLLPPAEVRQPVQRQPHPQPIHLHHRRHRGAEPRVPFRAPPVLPLRVRRRPVPEPGVDEQQGRDGRRLQARPRQRLCELPARTPVRLRRGVPDAAQAAQHQAPHVPARNAPSASMPAARPSATTRTARCWPGCRARPRGRTKPASVQSGSVETWKKSSANSGTVSSPAQRAATFPRPW